VLRCIASPLIADYSGMIALVRGDGEGPASHRDYASALREGAARARGGAVPSIASLCELLHLPSGPPAAAIDELLRDTGERTPPVLKAALTTHALREHALHADAFHARQLSALAVTLVLCVGGAITDAWLTLPRGAASDSSPRDTFTSLAREARAAERGLAEARDLIAADEQRVRDSFGRAAYSALDVLALLAEKLVISVPDAARALGQTAPTAGAAVARLVALGIAREVTGKARSRAFAYEGIVRALAP